MNAKILVGLDLGTDKCCITYQDNIGRPYIISDGVEYKISSIIGILQNGLLVGNEISKNNLYDIPIIVGIKRLIGHDALSKNAQLIATHSQYKLEVGTDNKLKIIIGEKKYDLQELVYILIKKIKDVIIANIGENFSLIITVPANFNEGQKNIILTACQQLNIDFNRFIYEPCSAAIAYINYFELTDFKNNDCKNILVFDFGAGTLDLAIVNVSLIDNELLANIISYVGDNNLGGLDIDVALRQLIYNKYPKLINKCNNDQSFKFIIEKIKIKLSTLFGANSNNTSFIEHYYNVGIVINKLEYVDMLNKLFKQRIINLLDQLHEEQCQNDNKIHKSKIKKDEIDQILLIGGSCYNPWVKDIVSNYYCKPIDDHTITISDHFNNYKIDLKEIAVSLGASSIGKKINAFGNGLIIMESLPLSIGINTVNGIMCKLLNKGDMIPCITKKYFTTSEDYQKNFEIEIYQGECDNITNNYLLGKFSINDLPLLKAGIPILIITISVTTDGLITVDGKLRTNEKYCNKIIINRNKIELDDFKIESNLYKYVNDDKQFNIIMKKYYTLVTMLNYLQYNLIDNVACKIDDKIIDDNIKIFWDDLILIYKIMKEIPKISPNIGRLKEIIINIIKRMNYNVNFDRVDCLIDSVVIEKLDELIKLIELKFQNLITTYQIHTDDIKENTYVTTTFESEKLPDNDFVNIDVESFDDIKIYLTNYLEHIDELKLSTIKTEKIFDYIDTILNQKNTSLHLIEIKEYINKCIT